MQPHEQRIIRELKNETCPQRVRDKARGQISARESSSRRLRYAVPMAIACVVLVCCLSVWQWHAAQTARQQASLAELNARERARVAGQAEDALGLVGSVLLDAGAHSEKIISDRTVPSLRNSLETTKNKIIPYIDL
jgi:hypothetical protein